jgi:hypothetical protein
MHSAPLGAGLPYSVSAKSLERLAERAPRGELHRYPYDHFDPFVGDAPPRVAADQLDLLHRAGLVGGRAGATPVTPVTPVD